MKRAVPMLATFALLPPLPGAVTAASLGAASLGAASLGAASLAAASLAALAATGCSSSSEPSAPPRYPEKRRPPPLRSASDGEILGADGVPPEDRLEASPTNTHLAPGWVVEDGKLVPEKEARHREQAHERSGYGPAGAKPEPDCDPNATAQGQAPDAEAAANTSGGRKRKPCPPSEKKP